MPHFEGTFWSQYPHTRKFESVVPLFQNISATVHNWQANGKHRNWQVNGMASDEIKRQANGNDTELLFNDKKFDLLLNQPSLLLCS